MGLRCFLVLMFLMHSGLALNCHNVFNVETITCHECIRCGGIWCMDPSEEKQCKRELLASEWCLNSRYEIKNEELFSRSGRIFKSTYVEKTAQPLLNPPFIQLEIENLPPVKGVLKARYEFLNNTSPNDFKIHLNLYRNAGKYVLDVSTTINPEVCSPNSRSEDVYVKVSINGIPDEAAVLKYHVICACDCSDEQPLSHICNFSGNFSCGSCQCNEEKHGKFCEKKYCPPRGDVSQSCVNTTSHEACWGNGQCDECHKCQCNDNVQTQGSQYFDSENDCIDLCSVIKETESLFDCLRKNNEGPCETESGAGFDNTGNGVIRKWDENVFGELYDQYRKLWINCSVTVESGVVEYSATKIKGVFGLKEIHMMRKDTGTWGAVVAPQSGGATIPVVIGVIAALAAMVAAAAGYVMWKGKGALPMTGSNYSNIEPENAVVENPLYKCPTSSFKNPMYAKS